MKQPKCVCVDPDARTCFERRHVGYFDDPDDIDRDDRCECSCHSRDIDGRTAWDDEDEGWDDSEGMHL